MSGANERLQGMQSALKERGVTDVKFCFNLNLAEKPNSEVLSSVCDFLGAYLEGHSEVIEKLGDAPKKG